VPNGPPIPGYEPVKFLGWLCGGPGGEIHLARREEDQALVTLRIFSGKPPQAQVESMRLLRRLRHPNILAVLDVGEDQGRWYEALEWAPPGTLASRLETGRLPWAPALHLTGGLATALQYARDQGLVCRLVSFASILLAEDGVARLCAPDFEAPSNSAPPGPVGRFAPMYSGGDVALVPPEWLNEPIREVTAAADVYRLGVVMYAALEGRPPFAGESVALVAQQILTTSPRPLGGRFWRRVPERVAAICLKCLAKSPLDRYATPGELARAITSVEESPATRCAPS
jgi:serine/threonine protein kinase